MVGRDFFFPNVWWPALDQIVCSLARKTWWPPEGETRSGIAYRSTKFSRVGPYHPTAKTLPQRGRREKVTHAEISCSKCNWQSSAQVKRKAALPSRERTWPPKRGCNPFALPLFPLRLSKDTEQREEAGEERYERALLVPFFTRSETARGLKVAPGSRGLWVGSLVGDEWIQPARPRLPWGVFLLGRDGNTTRWKHDPMKALQPFHLHYFLPRSETAGRPALGVRGAGARHGERGGGGAETPSER